MLVSIVKKIFILSLFLNALFLVSIVHAQTPQEIINGIQNNIQLSISPTYPSAGDTVTASIESYSTDLNRATINWLVNGTSIQKGVGLKSASFTVGKVGTPTTITAQITTAEGQSVRRDLKIQPADIDLLWQVNSYTPPFYKGKALYPHQGLITFVAIPNISGKGSLASDLNNYIFTWKKDGEVLGDFSGYGKNTFTLRGTVISRAFTIEVIVATKSGISVGSNSVRIQPQSPEVVFYPQSPLYGTFYNQAINSEGTLQQKEVSVKAIPYFFDREALNSTLRYDWEVNGSRMTEQTGPIITLRQVAEGQGQTSLKLTIENMARILQFASQQIMINYGTN